MVHTFQCLGVNIAVDVNSGAVHVLDELTYHLLEQVQPPMGEHCPAELCARLPQYDPAALEEAWQASRLPRARPRKSSTGSRPFPKKSSRTPNISRPSRT